MCQTWHISCWVIFKETVSQTLQSMHEWQPSSHRKLQEVQEEGLFISPAFKFIRHQASKIVQPQISPKLELNKTFDRNQSISPPKRQWSGTALLLNLTTQTGSNHPLLLSIPQCSAHLSEYEGDKLTRQHDRSCYQCRCERRAAWIMMLTDTCL